MNNFNLDYFKVDEPLNTVFYDANSLFLPYSSLEYLSSTIVYGTDASMIANGNWVENKEGPLLKNDIQKSFTNTIKELNMRQVLFIFFDIYVYLGYNFVKNKHTCVFLQALAVIKRNTKL